MLSILIKHAYVLRRRKWVGEVLFVFMLAVRVVFGLFGGWGWRLVVVVVVDVVVVVFGGDFLPLLLLFWFGVCGGLVASAWWLLLVWFRALFVDCVCGHERLFILFVRMGRCHHWGVAGGVHVDVDG